MKSTSIVVKNPDSDETEQVDSLPATTPDLKMAEATTPEIKMAEAMGKEDLPPAYEAIGPVPKGCGCNSGAGCGCACSSSPDMEAQPEKATMKKNITMLHGNS